MKKQRRKKLPSTKELKGKRVDGILYLDKGVGSGQFWNVHADGIGGVEQQVPHVQNSQRREDYD